MGARTRVFVAFFILVGLIAGLYVFTNWFSKTTGYVLGEDEKITLAQCLSGKGVVLYISSTCAACEEQAEFFGETAYEFLVVKTCDDIDDCPALGGVPAWSYSGRFYYGVQTLEELIGLSECDVVES